MLKALLIVAVCYELVGIGFLIYSLGIDPGGSSWSAKRAFSELRHARREWQVWIALSQVGVPTIIFFCLLYGFSKIFGINPALEIGNMNKD
jgi:hypothetical protein